MSGRPATGATAATGAIAGADEAGDWAAGAWAPRPAPSVGEPTRPARDQARRPAAVTDAAPVHLARGLATSRLCSGAARRRAAGPSLRPRRHRRTARDASSRPGARAVTGAQGSSGPGGPCSRNRFVPEPAAAGGGGASARTVLRPASDGGGDRRRRERGRGAPTAAAAPRRRLRGAGTGAAVATVETIERRLANPGEHALVLVAGRGQGAPPPCGCAGDLPEQRARLRSRTFDEAGCTVA